MKFDVDTHTHTYASGHAYSTLLENAHAAKENGLLMFCTTDHSQSMPGAPHYWFFANQKILPRFLNDVAVIRGVETNILNIKGEIDIPLETDSHLDWVIASLHEPVFGPDDKAAHTQALINVIKGGRIDALGHLGNPNFDFDYRAVIECAKEFNVAIEINNSSLKGASRIGSASRCFEIACIARDVGAYITTGTDAHFCQQIGRLELVSDLLDKVGMPPEQVITHTAKQFLAFLQLRNKPFIEEYSELY
ncbi:phosphatase [Psychromonas aquimarina]|uniref:phosphatase n=1 Tax=Psychromonas aquimarina TaxID=444919 RepID=UPI000408444B|nr:phosphatase [Psychromonas aquimarina]